MTPGSEIELNLQSLTKTRTAGDPDDDQIIYTDLTPTRLEQELAAMQTLGDEDHDVRRTRDAASQLGAQRIAR